MRVFEIDLGKNGETPTIIVELWSRSKKQPIQLNNFVSCTANFPGASGNQVAVTGTLVSSDLGKVQFILTKANVLALKTDPVNYQSFEVEFIYDSSATTVVAQYLNSLLIKPPLFTYV